MAAELAATCRRQARAPCAAPPTTPDPGLARPQRPLGRRRAAAPKAPTSRPCPNERRPNSQLASLQSRHADADRAAGGLDPGTGRMPQRSRRRRSWPAWSPSPNREPALAAELNRIETERERVRDRSRELGELLTAHRTHHTHFQAERTRLVTRLLQSGLLDTRLPATATPRCDTAARGAAAERRSGPSRRPPCWRWPRKSWSGSGPRPGWRPGCAEAARLSQERVALEERVRRVSARLAAGRTRQEELSGDAGR